MQNKSKIDNKTSIDDKISNKNIEIDWEKIDRAFDDAIEESEIFDEFVKEERKKNVDLNNIAKQVQQYAEEKSINTLEITLKKEDNDNE